MTLYPTYWSNVPADFQFIYPWAKKFGLRGLTVHFGDELAEIRTLTPSDIAELHSAYDAIASQADVSQLNTWCLSDAAASTANEAKEHIRGLLLLFERLAEAGIAPFTDGRVRFIRPPEKPFDWTVLPSHLGKFEGWLRKFESLGTEHELYEYVQNATQQQLDELAQLRELLNRDGESLREWCEAHNKKSDPAEYEAFQAEWLFLLVYFAETKIQALPDQ